MPFDMLDRPSSRDLQGSGVQNTYVSTHDPYTLSY